MTRVFADDDATMTGVMPMMMMMARRDGRPWRSPSAAHH
jgi:hypothetical protein